jgi:hypothetical protein
MLGFWRTTDVVEDLPEEGTSTVKIAVILFGTAAVIYSGAMLLKHFHPIFDDIHDSDSEED